MQQVCESAVPVKGVHNEFITIEDLGDIEQTSRAIIAAIQDGATVFAHAPLPDVWEKPIEGSDISANVIPAAWFHRDNTDEIERWLAAHPQAILRLRRQHSEPASAEPAPLTKRQITAANLNAALRLAKAGAYVFPCTTAKKPLCAWSTKSTRDPEQIKLWWMQHTSAIPAIDCGRTEIVTVDCDQHHDGDGWIEHDGVAAFAELEADPNHEPFERHPIVRTFGNGQHHIFRQPEGEPIRCVTGDLPKGIDVKAAGGFIIAPGAVIGAGAPLKVGVAKADGCYQPAPDMPELAESLEAGMLAVLPERLATIIRAPKAERIETASPSPAEARQYVKQEVGARERAFAQKALDGWYDELKDLTDDRNNRLNIGSHRLHRMVARGWLTEFEVSERLEQACINNGKWQKDGANQCRATIASGRRSGLADPHPDLTDREAVDPLFEEPDPNDDSLPVGFIEDDDSPIPEPDELVKGLLPKEGVAFIGGQSQAGKSFIAIHLAYCLASTASFFGRRIKERVGVAILVAEGSGTYRRRLRVACEHVCEGEKVPVAYLPDVPNLSDDKEITKLIPRLRQLDRYFRKTYGVRLGVVIIDTVAAAFDLDDEDDNSEAAKTIRRMKTLGTQVGVLIMPIHHYGKMSTTGLRGASGWKAGCDAILSVLANIDQFTGKVSGYRELALAKSRDGEAGPVAPFDLVYSHLGTDSDGDDFGSLYVEPLLDKASTIATSVKAKPDSDALTVFRAAFTECVCIPYRVRGTGPVLSAVRLDAVRAEFVKRWPTGETAAKKRNDAIRSAWRRGKADALKRGFSFESTSDGIEMVWLIAKSVTRDAA
jgi:AAA domain/Bifunctional DNA primase/polymerase, N-terminal